MNVTVSIPNDLAEQLGGEAYLPRRILEAVALEAYRAGRLTNAELRGILGFETRYELDGFLKAHGLYEEFCVEEVEAQVRAMERLGF